jgi:hypothetical protein
MENIDTYHEYMLSYQFVYILLGMLLMPLWLILFIARKDLRHKMLVLSFIIGIIGPFSELWYIQDYWSPGTVFNIPIGIESVIYPFLLGGISSVIYEEVFKKRYQKVKKKTHHWNLIFLILILIGFIILNILFFLFNINSIYASAIAYLTIASLIFICRKDLISDGIFSGVLLGIIFMVEYWILLTIYPNLFEKIWMMDNLSGITIVGMPVEELIWSFSWGVLAGPMYEFYFGLRFQKSKS